MARRGALTARRRRRFAARLVNDKSPANGPGRDGSCEPFSFCLRVLCEPRRTMPLGVLLKTQKRGDAAVCVGKRRGITLVRQLAG